MNNNKFSALVKEQKQKKLIGVLRDKSRRFLNDMEIESIARSMDADRQYSVDLYVDSVNFDPSCIPERQSGELDRKSTRLNSSHNPSSRMPSSA